MKIDDSYNRYSDKKDDPNYQRYLFAVSNLFGEVLDVGCGDGFGISLMMKNKNITNIFGVDNSEIAIDRAFKNTGGKLFVMDAEDLGFHDKTFDSVHCGQTLEHVKDDRKVLSEIKRVARSRVVISVPIKGGISEQHLREYTEDSIKKLVSEYFYIMDSKLFTGKHKRLVLINEVIY